MAKVKVGLNGYGVIGKRVADAVAAQEDMQLIGISDVAWDYRVKVALERGYHVYASAPEMRSVIEEHCIPVAGTLQDLLKQVDVIVDCTPAGMGERNKSLYEKAGVKAIFQGGEKHSLTGISFTAQVNYQEALNQQFARIVSCNTTGLCRIMHAFHRKGWIKRARAVLMRRATDPWESHINGMINTAVPETSVPSHQGPDVQSVINDLDITTMAGAGPYNLAHLHYAMIETTKRVSLQEMGEALWEEPRIAFVRSQEGLVALNTVVELMRDLRRPRNDMWEVAVWDDALSADRSEIYLTFQVDNEAITIPESIDAIRALTGLVADAKSSIEMTDKALGITKNFLPHSLPGRSIHSAEAEGMQKARV